MKIVFMGVIRKGFGGRRTGAKQKFLLLSGVLLLICSCIFPAKQQDCPERPLTQKEKAFIRKLSTDGRIVGNVPNGAFGFILH